MHMYGWMSVLVCLLYAVRCWYRRKERKKKRGEERRREGREMILLQFARRMRVVRSQLSLLLLRFLLLVL